jgi:hypothetical protein
MSNEDDFVEKLLQGLPKAPPMSPLEIKRFEKHVDSLVAQDMQKAKSKGWSTKFSAAASVVALAAGIAIFTNSSEVINPGSNQQPGIIEPTSQTSDPTGVSATPEPSKPNSNNATENNSNNGGSNPSVNSITKSPSPQGSTKSVPVLNYGIEYKTDEALAKSKVVKLATLGDSKLLTSAQISCSVRLGIYEELFAIDRGTYDGEDIEAYYFGKAKEALSIKIIGFGCTLIKDL